jgi:hypothetical protein
MSSVLCFAHGRESDWEALCIDFDIAVQGRSFDEVKSMLDGAVASYVDDARLETPNVRDRLLKRRAPWYVTLGMTLRLIAFNLFHGRKSEAQASFPVLCPV